MNCGILIGASALASLAFSSIGAAWPALYLVAGEATSAGAAPGTVTTTSTITLDFPAPPDAPPGTLDYQVLLGVSPPGTQGAATMAFLDGGVRLDEGYAFIRIIGGWPVMRTPRLVAGVINSTVGEASGSPPDAGQETPPVTIVFQVQNGIERIFVPAGWDNQDADMIRVDRVGADGSVLKTRTVAVGQYVTISAAGNFSKAMPIPTAPDNHGIHQFITAVQLAASQQTTWRPLHLP